MSNYPKIPMGVPGNAGQGIAPPTQQQGPAAPSAIYAGSTTLKDGQGVKILALKSLTGPQSVSFIVSTPFGSEPCYNDAVNTIPNDAASRVGIRLLGTALVGLGGIVTKVNFDVPIGQIAQATFIADTLDVSVRLYNGAVADAAPVDSTVYDDPSIWNGLLAGGKGVFVQAIGSLGVLGRTNLTRRVLARQVAAGGIANIPIPSHASEWAVIGPLSATVYNEAWWAVPGGAPALEPVGGNYTGADLINSHPVPSNCRYLVVQNNDAVPQNIEVIWRLGFGAGMGR